MLPKLRTKTTTAATGLALFLLIGLSEKSSAHGDRIAPSLSSSALLAKKAKQKKRRSLKSSKKRKKKKQARRKIGSRGFVGAGFFNVFPPMPTIHGYWQLASGMSFGGEVGYMALPLEEFDGNSTYFGVDGRLPYNKNNFVGLGLGRRAFQITTKSNFRAFGVDREIEWVRKVSQWTASPRWGWKSSNSNPLLVSLGLIIPFGNQFSIERDTESIFGVPDEALAEEEEEKGQDVKKVTNATFLQIELKYFIGF